MELQGKPLLILARGAIQGESSQAIDDLAMQLGVDGLLESGARRCRLEVVALPQPAGVVQAFEWLAKAAGSM